MKFWPSKCQQPSVRIPTQEEKDAAVQVSLLKQQADNLRLEIGDLEKRMNDYQDYMKRMADLDNTLTAFSFKYALSIERVDVGSYTEHTVVGVLNPGNTEREEWSLKISRNAHNQMCKEFASQDSTVKCFPVPEKV